MSVKNGAAECPEGKDELNRDPHSILEVFGVHLILKKLDQFIHIMGIFEGGPKAARKTICDVENKISAELASSQTIAEMTDESDESQPRSADSEADFMRLFASARDAVVEFRSWETSRRSVRCTLGLLMRSIRSLSDLFTPDLILGEIGEGIG